MRYPATWAVLSLIALPAAAQRTTFYPIISLSAFYTDNVFYVDSPAEDPSSGGFRLGFVLPVKRDLRNGSFSVIYTPRFETFSNFSELDNPGHSLLLNLQKQPDPRSAFRANVRLASTEDQGDLNNFGLFDPFLQQRTRREGGSLDLGYDRDLRGNFHWGASTGFSSWAYEDVIRNDQESDLEDRTELRANLGATRDLGAKSTLGLTYGYQQFDLDVSGEDTVHSLSLTYGRDLADSFSTAVSAGCFWGDRPNDPNCQLLGSLAFGRSFRRADLFLNLSHIPTAGGSQFGTSTNTTASLRIDSTATTQWNWNASIRFARRDPS